MILKRVITRRPTMTLTEVLKALQEKKSVPTYVFEGWALHMDPAELGRLVKEYIAESNHNSWDGFDRHHLTGIRAMLSDMIRYHINVTDDRPDHFKSLSTVNPV